MKQIFTAILISVSLIMLDARLVIGQESTAAKQTPAAAATPAEARAGQQQQDSSATKSTVQTPAPLDEKARKIKRMVDKVGVAGRLTLYLKNGDTLHGNVVSIDEESFQITEVDLRQVLTLHYKNVKKVREGYGNPNLFTGRRSTPPKGFRIALMAGLLFFALGLPIIGLRGTR